MDELAGDARRRSPRIDIRLTGQHKARLVAGPSARYRKRKAFALKPSVLTSLRRHVANLLSIHLGEFESRIVTVLETSYFDRIAEHLRSTLAGAHEAPAPARSTP